MARRKRGASPFHIGLAVGLIIVLLGITGFFGYKIIGLLSESGEEAPIAAQQPEPEISAQPSPTQPPAVDEPSPSPLITPAPQSPENAEQGQAAPVRQVSAEIYSDYALLIDADTGEALFEKNADERCYPASLTKIMTTLVALENLPSLEGYITLTPEMFDGLWEANASTAGFFEGERVSISDLLYGVMLPSGADASNAVAISAAGSIDGFVELMNQKAEELGLEDTHFTNVHGLHDDDHYTTARDMARLLKSALENELFRQIITARSYQTEPTDMNPEGLSFTSTMFKAMDSPRFDGGSILGGKTGYTQEAGLCLASLAKREDGEYILVTLHAPGDHYTEQMNITDAFTLYEAIGGAEERDAA